MWIELNPYSNDGIIPHGSPCEVVQFEDDMARDAEIARQMAAVGIRSNAEVFGDTPAPVSPTSRPEVSVPPPGRDAQIGWLALAS